jgi:hypothetical protein
VRSSQASRVTQFHDSRLAVSAHSLADGIKFRVSIEHRRLDKLIILTVGEISEIMKVSWPVVLIAVAVESRLSLICTVIADTKVITRSPWE